MTPWKFTTRTNSTKSATKISPVTPMIKWEQAGERGWEVYAFSEVRPIFSPARSKTDQIIRRVGAFDFELRNIFASIETTHADASGGREIKGLVLTLDTHDSARILIKFFRAL